MKNKKRLSLVLLALLLCVGIIIGGTLMLFTATTEKATNVVTFGNVSAKLQEFDFRATTPAWRDIGGGWNGLTWDKVQPGDNINKQARMENTGENNFFARFEISFVATDVDVPEFGTFDAALESEIQAYLAKKAVERYFTTLLTANDLALGTDGLYYYVNSDNTLKAVAPGAVVDVFDAATKIDEYFYIPKALYDALLLTDNSGDFNFALSTIESAMFTKNTPFDTANAGADFAIANYEISNWLADLEFTIGIQGFAVQSDNNPNATVNTAATYKDAFAGENW